MKLYILICGLALAIAGGTALAQGGSEGNTGQGPGPHGQGPGSGPGPGMRGNPEQRAARQERMNQYLGLSEEQQQQMKTIRESDATREQKREQIRAVLTDEQRSKMDMLREQHRAAKQAGGAAYRKGHQLPATPDEELDEEE